MVRKEPVIPSGIRIFPPPGTATGTQRNDPPMPETDIQTRVLSTSTGDLEKAADLLRDGRLVAFPTETVYGLGADACSGSAVANIYRAKGRPGFNPLIVHVPNLSVARAFARFHDDALRLATAFWPGPMTLVLPVRAGADLSSLAAAGLRTIGVRIPDHCVAQSLLDAFGGPVAAPSANPSGRISPTTADHVLAGLYGRIDAVVDGGRCEVGLESTIIGFEHGPALLRPGGLPVEAIEACLDRRLIANAPVNDISPDAPGQLTSHYAPGAPMRLNAIRKKPGEVLLGFGAVEDADLNLSPSGDLPEAAANLFTDLHRLDKCGARTIAVSAIPETGLGRAINDRLRRAAAPR